MGRLKDLFKFETGHLDDIWGDIKDNPERILVGAIDPASTAVWNKVLGKDWDPMVDQMGGATKQRYTDAEAKGINTGTARGLQDVAHLVAAAFAGNYGMNAAGSGEGGLMFSPEKMQGWGGIMNGAGNAFTAQEPTPPAPLSPSYAEELDYYDPYAKEYGYSSKRLKQKRKDAKGATVAKALKSRDPIDQNGAEIALIQALTKQLKEAKDRLAAIKARRRR